MRLTNRDISDNYRNEQYYFIQSDFLSAFAYWVINQSKNNTELLTPSLIAFEKYTSQKFYSKEIVVEFTYSELSEFVNEEVFKSIPEILQLNESFPPFEWIDLGALARNVFYMLLREYITQSLEE